jgi:hypothetical protein
VKVVWSDGESREWSGLSKALCYNCRQLFGSVSGFEKHQKRGKCLEPSNVGLELREGVWRHPAPTALASGQLWPSEGDGEH